LFSLGVSSFNSSLEESTVRSFICLGTVVEVRYMVVGLGIPVGGILDCGKQRSMSPEQS
jgi:hypothetical protein